MVNTFGFRPGGPFGMLAPFGFGPPGLQGPAASAGAYGQDDDVADVIPVGRRNRLRWKKQGDDNCQHVGCGAPTSDTYRPLCQNCGFRLNRYGDPMRLESGVILRDPIVPGEEPLDWIGERFRPPR